MSRGRLSIGKGLVGPEPPQLEPIIRVGLDYAFDELFGRAEVRYRFPLGQPVILDGGFGSPVKRLEEGQIAVDTGVDEPKAWESPSRTPDSVGRYARRVWGTIKRTGFVAFDP